MKVFVVMGNDYPDAVFSVESEAESYVASKIEEYQNRHEANRLSAPTHWRWYEFEMR